MSDTEHSVAAPRSENRCPACGQPLETLVGGCCPLCEHTVEGADVTSEDHTPYARALTDGVRGYGAMCRWVWAAGKHRLNHLGLCQPSPASRRFTWTSVTLFSAAIVLAVFSNAGWHVVTRAPGSLATSPAPQGRGWWRAVTRPANPQDRFADVLDTDLWWNLPYAILTALATGIVVMISGLLLARLIGWLTRRALRGQSREEPRLVCAVAYSTAWLVWMTLATIIIALRPLAQLSRVGQWPVAVPSAFFEVPAAILVMAGMLMWWFWLIRLAQTTPKDSQASVGRIFLIWTPPWTAFFVALVVFGYREGAPRLAKALNLAW